MTLLEQHICRILDFPEKFVGTARGEAFNKLTSTWMYVNGELMFVQDFFFTSSEILCKRFTDGPKLKLEVETLDAFLPESGLYVTPEEIFSVTRLTHKHWAKSFKRDDYSINLLGKINYGGTGKVFTDKCYHAISKTKPELIIKDNNKIWIYGEIDPVATIINEEIIVYNPLYTQEVIDFQNREVTIYERGW